MKTEEVLVTAHGHSGFSSDSCENLCHKKTLPWISVVQAVEGSYDIGINGENQVSTGEGGIFLAPSLLFQTITHHINPQTGVGRFRWAFLNITINKNYRYDDHFSYPLIVPQYKLSEFNACLDDIFSSTNAFSSNIAYNRMAMLINEISTEKTASKLTPAVDYITSHFAEKITVEKLSKLCYISKSAFFDLFKKEKLFSPIRYINEYRLSIAEEYIRSTDTPILTIARNVGFEDYAYFNKTFRKHFNASPREYRRLYDKQCENRLK